MAYFREVKEKEASLQITKGKLYCNEFCFNISTLVEKKCCFLYKKAKEVEKNLNKGFEVLGNNIKLLNKENVN